MNGKVFKNGDCLRYFDTWMRFVVAYCREVQQREESSSARTDQVPCSKEPHDVRASGRHSVICN